MLGEGVEFGDKLIVNVAQENLDWGYNPCPNGSVVSLLAFGEITHDVASARCFGIKPGVYVNRYWFNVRLPNGGEDCIYSGFFLPADKEKYEQRLRQWKLDHPGGFLLNFEFIRPL